MIQQIVLDSEERIRQVSKEIELKDLKDSKIREVLVDLVDTLNSYKYGVAISAIQISKPIRLFLIKEKTEMKDEFIYSYFINPKVLSVSDKMVARYESCLSVNHSLTYGEVSRNDWIKLEYYNELGECITKKYTGFIARIILHEIDHLNGILFTDKTDSTKLMNLEEYIDYINKKKAV